VLVAGAVAVPLTAVPAEADDPVYVAWSARIR
jgi:hypothetical protein